MNGEPVDILVCLVPEEGCPGADVYWDAESCECLPLGTGDIDENGSNGEQSAAENCLGLMPLAGCEPGTIWDW